MNFHVFKWPYAVAERTFVARTARFCFFDLSTQTVILKKAPTVLISKKVNIWSTTFVGLDLLYCLHHQFDKKMIWNYLRGSINPIFHHSELSSLDIPYFLSGGKRLRIHLIDF